MESKTFITGFIGTILSGTGALTQTHQVFEIISLILTILGTILTFIVMPLLNWYQKSKKDGKITIDEVKEGGEILADGIEEVGKEIDKHNEEN